MSTILEKLAWQGDENFKNAVTHFGQKLIHMRNQHIKDILSDYTQVAHRLEYIATVCGIDFIDDAKANTINASWYSLECMKKPVIWIVNDIKPNNDFDKIISLICKKVKSIIIFDKNHSLSSPFSDYINRIFKTSQINHAVELAYTIGAPGDVVLFSPANERNMGFDNYEQEGNQFTQAVKRL